LDTTPARSVLIGVAVLAAAAIGLQAQSALPRVEPSNLVYQGAFQVPNGIHSGGQADAGFEYGGTAIGFNPARTSLFMAGHDWDQFVGEISIPAPGGTATLLQALVDPTEGKLGSINPGDPNSKKIGGTLLWRDKLIVSAYSYYDGNSSQVLSHFVRPITLSTRGQVTGPVRVGPLGAGFYSGYMTLVPPKWQTQLGGAALTGNADLSIVGRTSLGPAVFAFDPDHLSASGAKPLVYYPIDHPTLGPWAGANTNYGGSDTMKGVAFPPGTSSVLFFGRHGGTFCYGPGTADPNKAGTIDPNVDPIDPYCYDPDNSSKGVHGYPYSAYVWAYDANDLSAVHAGQTQPWDVRPYAVWALSGIGAQIGGAAYDPVTRRIYLSEMFGDGPLPLVHVFAVSNASTPLRAPTNLQVVR
jgi:hypothetical protein